MINRIFVVFLVVIAPGQVQANLVDNGTFITDTSTSLDWFVLTESNFRSYNDVSSQFGVGGDFEGYRYATGTEIATFFDSAGGTAPYVGLFDLPGANWSTPLLNLWGILYVEPFIIPSLPNGFVSYFMYDSPELNGNVPVGCLVLTQLQFESPNGGADLNCSWLSNISGVPIDAGTASEVIGSALVRESLPQVPLPAAFWLFGTALIGLVGFSRRRTAA